MTSAVFDKAIESLGKGVINWTSGQVDIWCPLGNANFGTNVAKTTWATYADPLAASEVATGGGYAAGGGPTALPLTTVAVTGSVAAFKSSANKSWGSASTFDCYYAWTQHGTTATTTTNPLLTYHDLGGKQSVASGTLTLQWATAGIWTITVSAAV